MNILITSPPGTATFETKLIPSLNDSASYIETTRINLKITYILLAMEE
jgi:hypothetical protein